MNESEEPDPEAVSRAEERARGCGYGLVIAGLFFALGAGTGAGTALYLVRKDLALSAEYVAKAREARQEALDACDDYKRETKRLVEIADCMGRLVGTPSPDYWRERQRHADKIPIRRDHETCGIEYRP